ncbi:MAG TPA: stage II sporulation protein M, partial [Microthrixaceae bacterium]|nr:stage II sporulation protein M [Microthrixaceae bacterium]
LPHGLLEIASILVAGGAGLQLSWAMIAPGDRTRAAALKDAGLRSVVIVIGLVVCFVVAGFIEGFVTPSELPTAMRIGIGVSVLALFVAYIVGFGRQAVCDGATGLFGEESPGRRTPSQFDTDRPDPADSPAEPGTEPLRTTTA